MPAIYLRRAQRRSPETLVPGLHQVVARADGKPNSVPSKTQTRFRGRRSFLWDACCQTPQARYPPSTLSSPADHRGSGRDQLPGAACACTRWGLPCLGCHQPSGALLPHPFTLTPGRWGSRRLCDGFAIFRGRFAFCCTFPDPCNRWDRWVLPTTVSCRVRTFLPRSIKLRERSSVREQFYA